VKRKDESWLPVPGYEDRYDISDQGRVRSYYRWGSAELCNIPQRILRPGTHTCGYLQVYLHGGNGKPIMWLVHRLVMLAFIGPCPAGHEVNHLDGNKANNHLQNLEYSTKSANQKHAVLNGLLQPPGGKGEDNYSAKLTDAQLGAIRLLYATGRYTYTELATLFRVTSINVGHIIQRRTWTHI
jgi:hypothetical protein